MAQKVLVTGVYGLIAGAVYDRFCTQPNKYEVYGLARRQVSSDRVAEGVVVQVPEDRFFLVDMSSFDAVCAAFDGMDTVVHMAANPDPGAPWEAILQSNMIGAYNAFEACRQAGVKRIVYASSIMTSWGNQLDEPYKAIKEERLDEVSEDFHIVKHTDPVRPCGAKRLPGRILMCTDCRVCACVLAGSMQKIGQPVRVVGHTGAASVILYNWSN